MAPALWRMLCGLVHLDEPCLTQWWHGVSTARWSEVRAWREELLLYTTIGDPAHCAAHVWTPIRLVRIVELLVREGTLPRRTAQTIETAILDHTSIAGHWK